MFSVINNFDYLSGMVRQWFEIGSDKITNALRCLSPANHLRIGFISAFSASSLFLLIVFVFFS